MITNFIWAIVYFKQLFYPSSINYSLGLSGIVLLPFVYFVASLSVLTIPNDESRIIKSPGMIWTIIFFIGLITLFVILGKYKYIFLLYFVLLEPLKVKFIDMKSIKYLKIKYVSLAIVSFLVFSISTVLPPFNSKVNTAAMWMGGIYFSILNLMDYTLPFLTKKIENWQDYN